MALTLILTAIALAAVSGAPGLLCARSSNLGQRLSAGLMGLGALAGLAGALWGLLADAFELSAFPWPAVGDATVGLDALSAFFLVPVFLMGGLGSLYGLGYWPQDHHQRNARKLQVFWGLMVAGMALLVVARHVLLLLLGWELMALCGFLLVSTEDQREESCRAAYIYLIGTHVSTLALFALFALWRWATGSFALATVAPGALGVGVQTALFLLALVGFGLKAGIMPLHFWLPGAHANAPSHVSAMLSGVVLKMGIYGLVRFLSLMPNPPVAWGGLIITLGAVSGLLGVVFALGQHDLKRLLAYHSVENIGIILLGLGLALLGRSLQHPEWVVLGLAGCLLHVWNHALFKSLLFFTAGSVLHGTRTRQLDQLGGLAGPMPWTALMFLVGAVAICGLPPLNGFVSEFLVYLGLWHTVTTVDTGGGAGLGAAMIAVPVLAMIGALAVACFVKVYGSVFLGLPRTLAASRAKESPLSMRAPMLVLALCCALIGLAPALVVPVLEPVLAHWSPEALAAGPGLGSLAPLSTLSALSMLLVALVLALGLALARKARLAPRQGTWDCGYARPTSRMQYTASSFAQTIVDMFGWVLRQHVQQPRLEGHFPAQAKMQTHVDELVLDRVLLPAGRRVERWFAWFHLFQQGLTQQYVLYILIAVVLLLGSLIPLDEMLARLFLR
ncbi:MAG: proton-conducting transporter membrane subunit, partial [Humidesulfovibrio sp.]|nr:proton-conducting transporter membrane subunit [Humidesulfovibrio sp.]